VERPPYGLDAPGVVRNFALGATACAVAAAALVVAGAAPFIASALALCAVMFAATVAAMLHSSRRGKLIERDRLLDGLALAGDEALLDVGCGSGLLLVGAAKRLPDGRAVGVDVSSHADGSGNGREAVVRNARAEGVMDRIEVVDGDMRDLPFPDATFDAVVASIAIHRLPGRDERERACTEIARVLRPGGRVAVLDFAGTHDYALAFEDAGLVDVTRSGMRLRMYPPVRVVRARRPG
jgi:SAM-dependent methyltransferase